MPQKSKDLIYIGKIVSAHGIKGSVKIQSFTSDPKNILSMELFDQNEGPIKIKYLSIQKDILTCGIDCAKDRNEAENLRGTKLFSRKQAFPALDESEHYIENLIDLPVQNTKNEIIGKVLGVYNFGAGDVVEIEFINGSSSMLPFTKAIFPEVTKERVVFINPVID